MKLDDLLTNKLLRVIFPGLIFLVLIFFFMDKIPTADKLVNEINCKTELEVKNQEIKGVVILKYLDKRKIRHFKYVNGTDTLDTDVLGGLGSDFYEYLEVGDSIRKNVGSLEFKARRLGNDTLHILSFDCK